MERVVGVVFFILFSSSYAEAACPDGWLRHGTKCYHLSREVETWSEAKILCEAMTGYLVEIDDSTEQHYIELQIKSSSHTNYWIGLTDLAEEGSWMWMHSHQLATYTAWYPNEPNNSGGQESCGMIGGTGAWNDSTCRSLYYYICEKDDEVEVVGRR